MRDIDNEAPATNLPNQAGDQPPDRGRPQGSGGPGGEPPAGQQVTTSAARIRTALVAVQLLFGVNYLVSKRDI